MKHRFVVAVDGMTSEEEKRFIAWIQENGLGWWHWIANFWLLTSHRDSITAELIRDTLNDIARGKYKLVLEIEQTFRGLAMVPTRRSEICSIGLSKPGKKTDATFPNAESGLLVALLS